LNFSFESPIFAASSGSLRKFFAISAKSCSASTFPTAAVSYIFLFFCLVCFFLENNKRVISQKKFRKLGTFDSNILEELGVKDFFCEREKKETYLFWLGKLFTKKKKTLFRLPLKKVSSKRTFSFWSGEISFLRYF